LSVATKSTIAPLGPVASTVVFDGTVGAVRSAAQENSVGSLTSGPPSPSPGACGAPSLTVNVVGVGQAASGSESSWETKVASSFVLVNSNVAPATFVHSGGWTGIAGGSSGGGSAAAIVPSQPTATSARIASRSHLSMPI
jgi:hypothetical protein